MEKRKRYKVADLEQIAQQVVKRSLQEAISNGASWLNSNQDSKLFLQVAVDDHKCVFGLFTDPEDATWDSKNPLVVARVTIDRYTKEQIGEVEVYLPPVLASEIPEIN